MPYNCILSSRHYHTCRHDNGCESRRCLLLFGPSSKAHSAIAPMLPSHLPAALCDSHQKLTLLSHRFEALFICCIYNILHQRICQLLFYPNFHIRIFTSTFSHPHFLIPIFISTFHIHIFDPDYPSQYSVIILQTSSLSI